jgi:hypothetical protein
MGAALGVFQKKVFATCRFSVLSTCYDVSAWKRSDETFRLDFSLLLKVNLGFATKPRILWGEWSHVSKSHPQEVKNMVTKKKASAKSKKTVATKAPKQELKPEIPAATSDIPEPVRAFLKATSISKGFVNAKEISLTELRKRVTESNIRPTVPLEQLLAAVNRIKPADIPVGKLFATCRFSVLSTCYDVSACGHSCWKVAGRRQRVDPRTKARHSTFSRHQNSSLLVPVSLAEFRLCG